ncbi:cell cycle control protein, partial [Aspergillus ochraceoroseus]
MAETAELETPPAAAVLPTDTVDQSETEQELVATDDNALTQATETAVTVIETDGNGAQKKTKKIIRRKRRPARPQVDPATVKSEPPPQTGTVFNIWYNKWSGGDREDKYLSKHAAPSRCNVAKDSGYTRADKVPGSYFCLFFARG